VSTLVKGIKLSQKVVLERNLLLIFRLIRKPRQCFLRKRN
jgi:hypothetical protein